MMFFRFIALIRKIFSLFSLLGRKPDLSGVDERIGRPWEHAHKGLHSHSYTEGVKPVSFTKVIIFIFFLIKGFISVFVNPSPTICKCLFQSPTTSTIPYTTLMPTVCRGHTYRMTSAVLPTHQQRISSV